MLARLTHATNEWDDEQISHYSRHYHPIHEIHRQHIHYEQFLYPLLRSVIIIIVDFGLYKSFPATNTFTIGLIVPVLASLSSIIKFILSRTHH